ncbi:MAG TPA: YqgE/AlgH family protein [Steroidobacteraceae bacterium]|nr:YqgE/AlgH family protein [Steroidobacteraceae bacterium]
MTDPTTSLSNHLLIAMPQLADPNFVQTVTLVCEHGERGALGIVLNRPLPMTLAEVFDQMKIEPTHPGVADLPVLRGGPVHTDRGFVLHPPGGSWDSSHRISDAIQVTTSRDVLAAMATGTGPAKACIALGYAGWEAGQLKQEIRDNSWLAVEAADDVIFDLPFDERWPAALRLLGVEASQLAAFAGHA